MGRRFNGYDLINDLADRGITSKMAVLAKSSRNPNVVRLREGLGDELLQRAVERVESRRSMNDLLVPWGRRLSRHPEFLGADVVHYHLIHNGLVSLLDLPDLFAVKPSVWTFHDPWPMTGHCIHPLDCAGWPTGCDSCPHLDWHFEMQDDCAGRMWRVKRQVYRGIDPDIVVASGFMEDMVHSSPLTSHFEHVHCIPFGIRTGPSLPNSERLASRKRLGIPAGDFVVMFRASKIPLKGMELLLGALALHDPVRSTTLLSVDSKGMLRSLRRSYNVVELGWVEDASVYPAAFCASDVFAMPSLAEGFGLMALEAMAASRPVVCFDDTAVADVTHAPDCGIAVPHGDVTALRSALDRLALDPEEAHRRGNLGRAIAEREYDYDRYLDRMADLYRGAVARQQAMREAL